MQAPRDAGQCQPVGGRRHGRQRPPGGRRRLESGFKDHRHRENTATTAARRRSTPVVGGRQGIQSYLTPSRQVLPVPLGAPAPRVYAFLAGPSSTDGQPAASDGYLPANTRSAIQHRRGHLCSDRFGDDRHQLRSKRDLASNARHNGTAISRDSQIIRRRSNPQSRRTPTMCRSGQTMATR